MQLGWIWISILVISIIVEALTDQLISIWFAPAAIIATILDFLKVQNVIQIIVFLLVSLVGIILVRRFVNKFLKPDKSTRTNIDAIIGERCIVTEKIDNFAGCGQAKVRGQIWSARGVNDDDVFEAGEVLSVVAIEGVKLICIKK